MTKILISADLHLHPHKNSEQRLKDCVDALDWVFKTAHSREIDHIVFLGDLFHSRQKVHVSSYQWTFEIFCKWLQNNSWKPTVYLLVGNHDMVHKFSPDICSVKPLASIEGVKVIDKPCYIDNMAFLPYTENPIADLEQLKGSRDLLLGHIALNGAILNSVYQTRSEVVVEHDGDMTVVDADTFKDWKKVFLGHYHGAQKVVPNIEYVGSPLQLSFGEAFQEKHLIIYEVETGEIEYVINDFSPKHFIISQQDVYNYDLTNNFVRIMVDDISSAELAEFRNDMAGKNLGSLDIRLKPQKEQDGQAVDDALAVVLHNDVVIEKYIECMSDLEELHGLQKDKLLAVGKKIIDNATSKENE